MTALPPDLEAVLGESRRLGFLGPGELGPQIAHAEAFGSAVEAVTSLPPERFLDLGSGGGLPGLVLALRWPAARAVLLDAMQRRTDFLRTVVDDLALGERVEVVCDRAEVAARTALREAFDLVTARSFGPPAVTAECATGFLRPGGFLAVSEPPDDDDRRWPADDLATLALVRVGADGPGPRIAVLRREAGLDDRWPRRVGIPTKRPLWG